MKYFIFIVLLSLTSYAEDIAFRKLNKGCPLNSECSDKAGKLWNGWMRILELDDSDQKFNHLNSFVKRNGIPFKVWLTSEKKLEGRETILWDSPCKNHREPNPSIFLADVFLKELQESPETLLNHAYVLDKKNKVKRFPIPRDYTPTLIKNQGLIFTMEEEGYYYGLHISEKGKITISRPVKNEEGIFEVQCPKELISKFETLDGPKNLYASKFCHSVWNADQKEFSTILMGWSCL